jgi:hypothetical protein
MKTKQFVFGLHSGNMGWILLKPDVQVSIGYCITENENRVTGRPKIPLYICGRWATK